MNREPPTIPFLWSWYGPTNAAYTTYRQIPYAQLPPIPVLDGTLSWLGRPGWLELPGDSSNLKASRQRATAEARASVHALVRQADELGLLLPQTFTHLMAAPELYERIPEYAGCWFNLHEAQLDPCPGSPDGFVVRFLNDQQDCVLWYLYINRWGDEAVLAVGDPSPEAPSPYLEYLSRPDEDGPLNEEERQAVIANTVACSPIFEAFIYRWWLEVTIFAKLNGFDATQLNEEEHRYLAHYPQTGL